MGIQASRSATLNELWTQGWFVARSVDGSQTRDSLSLLALIPRAPGDTTCRADRRDGTDSAANFVPSRPTPSASPQACAGLNPGSMPSDDRRACW